MGTTFTPKYATLTIEYFDIHFNNLCKLKWGREFQEFIWETWSHFLDNCQTPLDKNSVKPVELSDTLKSIDEAIKFTTGFGETEVPFWDVLINWDNSGIWMDLS